MIVAALITFAALLLAWLLAPGEQAPTPAPAAQRVSSERAGVGAG